jgi:uncharacterized protein (TIGR02453 family)
MAFSAFPEETVAFLRQLRTHNSREWFEAHASQFRRDCLKPAKQFVQAAGTAIREFIPGIQAQPRVLGSIFRLSRDTRYAEDDRPYKDYIDFWFWEGARNEAVSGLFARVHPDFIGVGAGCHGFDKQRLELFRRAVVHPQSGMLLARITRASESAGYRIQGEHYKRAPKDFPDAGPAARFLRFNALFVHKDEPADIALRDGALVAVAVSHWRALADLHGWITKHVQRFDRLA